MLYWHNMTSLWGKRFLPLLSLRSGATPFIDLDSALVLIYSMRVRSSICHEVHVQCSCDVWSVDWYTDLMVLRTSSADFLTTPLKLRTCLGNPRTTETMAWTSVLLFMRREGGMTNQCGVFKTARESYVFLHTVGRGWGIVAILITPGLATGSGWPQRYLVFNIFRLMTFWIDHKSYWHILCCQDRWDNEKNNLIGMTNYSIMRRLTVEPLRIFKNYICPFHQLIRKKPHKAGTTCLKFVSLHTSQLDGD